MSDFSRFIQSLQRLNKSAHTVSNYQRDLLALAVFFSAEDLSASNATDQVTNAQAWAFLDGFRDWAKMDRDAIEAFVAFRMEMGASARTLARQLSAIRSFYTFLLEEQRVAHNPAKGVKAPKQPQPLPKSLDVDLTRQLLEQPLQTWQDVRDQAIYELLYSGGLRVSELAQLDLSPGLDNWQAGWVRVMGKGQKERQAPIGTQAKAALQAWLNLRPDHAKPDETAVFVNRFGQRLGVRSIQKHLDERALKAGLPTKMSPHRLRHACATHVLESSGDLRAVQELLGHANLSTTQIYTKLDLQHLATVYDKAHPRAKKTTKATRSDKKQN
ncbi:MAG: tyrosine recombinase XerC [Hydrogenovibrio sp.]